MAVQPYPVRHPEADYVIIELFGGDNNLSDFVAEDLSEMMSGAQGNVAVVAMTDVFEGPARVIELTKAHGITLLDELGEVDTGDPDFLADVLARALVSYPSTARVAIGFWDHGSGVFDEEDRTPLRRVIPGARIPRWRLTRSRRSRRLFFSEAEVASDAGLRAMLHDDQSGGLLTNREAGRMLRNAFEAAGRTSPVDLIFSDTCLNGMAEVLCEFEAQAQCVVGSEELEPGDGWDYHEWLKRIGDAPPADADAWGRHAVDAMEAGYTGRPGQFPVTLSAVRAGCGIAEAFAALIRAAGPFGRDGFRFLDWARSQTQNFVAGSYDSYDMIDFARQLVAGAEIPEIVAAAEELERTVQRAMVHSIAMGDTVARATGLAFWFPSSRGSFLKDASTYRDLKVDEMTGWAAYLETHR